MGAEKRTVAVVACSYPRSGTSAMMGILKTCGLDIGGRKGKINGPGPKNPKGHFELLSLEYGFFRKYYRNLYFNHRLAPKISLVTRIARENKQEFKDIFDQEFGDSRYVALKGFGYLMVPILAEFTQELDVKIIGMRRPIKDRVSSALRVWDYHNPGGPKIPYRKMYQEIRSWDNLASQLRNNFNVFPYHFVNFYELVKFPVNVSRKVCKFLGVGEPPIEKVKRWIEKGLVNRRKL